MSEIRGVLRESDFLGEGHRKVRARLRPRGIRVGKNRVLRLMREHGAAGAGAPRASTRRPEPQRPDHDRCAQRAVGHRCGAPMPHGSTRRRTAGAGSSWQSITVSATSWDGMWPRRETAGRPSSRSARACGPTWGATRPGSRSDSDYAMTGVRSTRPTSSRPSSDGSGSGRPLPMWGSRSARAMHHTAPCWQVGTGAGGMGCRLANLRPCCLAGGWPIGGSYRHWFLSL